MAINHRIAKLEQHAARIRPPSCGCGTGPIRFNVIPSPVFKTMSEIRAYDAMQPPSRNCPVCGRPTLIVIKAPVDASTVLRRSPLPETGT